MDAGVVGHDAAEEDVFGGGDGFGNGGVAGGEFGPGRAERDVGNAQFAGDAFDGLRERDGLADVAVQQSWKGNGCQARGLDFVASAFVGGFGLGKKIASRLEFFLVERPAGVAEVGDGADFHLRVFS